ncbi:MAG: OmpH family outer membrane protein [Proteobacteria bacterium]|nr:OmpH family outer membrane protein [Pseudomonadota bacterium]
MRITPKSLFALALAALALTGATSAQAQKIAVVDNQRIIGESPQYRTSVQALEAEFGPRQKQLEAQKKDFDARVAKFQRDQPTMADGERTKTERDLRDAQLNLERRGKEFQEDVQMRQNEELQRVQKAIFEAVRAYAKEKGFDIVLASGVIYNSESVDITAQVLANLQAKAASAPAAPAAAPAAPPAPKK